MSTHNFVLIGEAGSGKTEIAANLALRLAEDMPVPVCLIDMDQTKCMFRAAESGQSQGQSICTGCSNNIFLYLQIS